MPVRSVVHAGWLLALMLLSGCASWSRGPIVVPDDLRELQVWQARGRLGVSSEQGGGSGSFIWQQRNDRSDVEIRGPVGIGSVKLQVRGNSSDPELQLETSDGQRWSSAAAWRELEARLGAPIPAGRLRYWLLGLAAPGEHRWSEPAPDGTSVLEQDGWRIDYQKYSADEGPRVPVRLRASHGDARVRIVVDRWQLGAQ